MNCDYGCGREAKHQFKNGKWCCSKSANSCESMKLKNSSSNKRKIISEDTRLKMSHAKIGKKDSEDTRKRKSIARHGEKNPMFGKVHPNRKTATDIINEHPFFTLVEEIRDDLKSKRVQVRCKLNTCRKWFTPSYDIIRYRIYALEHPDGNDGLFFYCSDDCKKKCSVYNLKPNQIVYKSKSLYTESEYQTFRKFVLKRDNYKCQFCGIESNIVHHERPQKLEPFFALDPYFAWTCCEKCHYEKGHQDECSPRQLGLKECKYG